MGGRFSQNHAARILTGAVKPPKKGTSDDTLSKAESQADFQKRQAISLEAS